MPDLSFLAGPFLIAATVFITLAISRRVHANRNAYLEQRANVLANDRDALLQVVGDFVDAIEHRPDRLDQVASQARNAIDGRQTWTRAY
ncbi:hypothetical protein [Nonomuraea sp. NPDC049646]|uniref:hypothetical protein n=1 Tax=unclassified Nonomuraea TaxID=2593643 RepID=UPI00378E3ABA